MSGIDAIRLAAINSVHKPPAAADGPTSVATDGDISVEPVSQETLQKAITDLRRLGLTFIDIYKQSGVNPDFLIDTFTSFGFAVPISSRIELAAERLKAGRVNYSPLGGAIKPTIQSRSTIPTPPPTGYTGLTPQDAHQIHSHAHHRTHAHSRVPKFGSDRWSGRFRFDISDEEDGEGDQDDGQQDNRQNGHTSSSSNEHERDSHERESNESSTPVAQKSALDQKLEEIRRMTALVKELEAKKAAAHAAAAEAEDFLTSVDEAAGEAEPTQNVVSQISSDTITSTNTRPALANVSTSEVPGNLSPDKSLESIKQTLTVVLQRQDTIIRKEEELQQSLKRFRVETLEQEVEELKIQVEQKKRKIDEITSQAGLIQQEIAATEEERHAISQMLVDLQKKISAVNLGHSVVTQHPLMESAVSAKPEIFSGDEAFTGCITESPRDMSDVAMESALDQDTETSDPKPLQHSTSNKPATGLPPLVGADEIDLERSHAVAASWDLFNSVGNHTEVTFTGKGTSADHIEIIEISDSENEAPVGSEVINESRGTQAHLANPLDSRTTSLVSQETGSNQLSNNVNPRCIVAKSQCTVLQKETAMECVASKENENPARNTDSEKPNRMQAAGSLMPSLPKIAPSAAPESKKSSEINTDSTPKTATSGNANEASKVNAMMQSRPVTEPKVAPYPPDTAIDSLSVRKKRKILDIELVRVLDNPFVDFDRYYLLLT